MEEIFNKLVEEFGLSVSVDKEGEKYAKFPGIGGFLIALVRVKLIYWLLNLLSRTIQAAFSFLEQMDITITKMLKQ